MYFLPDIHTPNGRAMVIFSACSLWTVCLPIGGVFILKVNNCREASIGLIVQNLTFLSFEFWEDLEINGWLLESLGFACGAALPEDLHPQRLLHAGERVPNIDAYARHHQSL